MLSIKAVEEFKKIYEKNYHKKISYETALEMATKVMEIVRIIYLPMEEENESKNGKKEKFN